MANVVQDRYGLTTLQQMREAIWSLQTQYDNVRLIQGQHSIKLAFIPRPRLWDDMRGPGTSAMPANSAPTWANFQGQQYAWSFSAIADQKLHFDIQLSHGQWLGRPIDIHVHFSPNDNNAGTIQWRAYYSWANINEAFPADTQIDNTFDAGGQYMHQFGEIAEIAKADATISSMLKITLYRMGTLDTYASPVWLHEMDCHIQLDTAGSKTEELK